MMKKVRIRSFAMVTVIACAISLYAAYGSGHVAAKAADHHDETASVQDIEAIRQLGRTMGDAVVSLDMGTLDRIYADDWAAVTKNRQVIGIERMTSSIPFLNDHVTY